MSVPTPTSSLASDNAASVHPAVLEAIAAANTGHALAYGDDEWTRRATEQIAGLFSPDAVAFLTLTGSGSNVMALGCLLGPADAVVCGANSHINVDETGAPERLLGAKLIDLPTPEGKLVPEQLDELRPLFGVDHHVQPAVLALTQSTEMGTLYEPDEIRELCDAAHGLGMRVYVDGARLANAVAALGGDRAALRSFTVDAGVDALSFGGTKNGLMGAEAVVFLDPQLATRARYLRKQANQLASKMRYVAAQFLAILQDDLWIDLADHANRMAMELWKATNDIPGVTFPGPPAVNSLFPMMPRPLISALQEWTFFWDWEPSRDQVRWMTSWDTSEHDVELIGRGIRHFSTTTID